MPVIYVSIREGNAPEQKKRIAAGIHKAMIDVMGLPEDDYNQVFLESSADNMIFDPNYFGLYRSPKAVFIHMFFNHRPAEMKAKLFETIADNLVRCGVKTCFSRSARRRSRTGGRWDAPSTRKPDWTPGWRSPPARTPDGRRPEVESIASMAGV